MANLQRDYIMIMELNTGWPINFDAEMYVLWRQNTKNSFEEHPNGNIGILKYTDIVEFVWWDHGNKMHCHSNYIAKADNYQNILQCNSCTEQIVYRFKTIYSFNVVSYICFKKLLNHAP